MTTKESLMDKKTDALGFTLIEMIGVLAIIAILASVASPRIIETIEDAKIATYAQQTKTLVGAIANFNADTGRWPNMYSTSDPTTHPHHHQLMINALDAASNKIPGWKGPYLDKEPSNPFQPDAYQGLYTTASDNWACDVDGDGKTDGKFIVYRTDGVSDKIAEKISAIYDNDTDTESWKKTGRIKRYKGTSESVIANCLSRI